MMDMTDLIQFKIIEQIQAYADKHGISFKEAADRAKLSIDGQVIEPLTQVTYEYTPEENGN